MLFFVCFYIHRFSTSLGDLKPHLKICCYVLKTTSFQSCQDWLYSKSFDIYWTLSGASYITGLLFFVNWAGLVEKNCGSQWDFNSIFKHLHFCKDITCQFNKLTAKIFFRFSTMHFLKTLQYGHCWEHLSYLLLMLQSLTFQHLGELSIFIQSFQKLFIRAHGLQQKLTLPFQLILFNKHLPSRTIQIENLITRCHLIRISWNSHSELLPQLSLNYPFLIIDSFYYSVCMHFWEVICKRKCIYRTSGNAMRNIFSWKDTSKVRYLCSFPSAPWCYEGWVFALRIAMKAMRFSCLWNIQLLPI